MSITRSKTVIIILLILSFLVLFSGCYLVPEEKIVIQPSLMKPPKITYNTVTVEKDTIEKSISLTGHFKPTTSVNVYFTRTEGRISLINCYIGDLIKEGDILLSLDATDLKYNLEIQELYFKRAQLTFDRIKRAYDAGTISYDDFEAAKIDLNIEKKQLDDMKNKIDNSNLYAPISGQIIDMGIMVSLGGYVSTYDFLYTVADLTTLELQYSTTDKNKGFIYLNFEAGMKVEVEYDHNVYEGEVLGLTSVSITDDVVEKTVHVDVKGLPDTVKLGQSAVIKLVLGEAENVLVIPKHALRTYVDRIYVQILEEGIKKERDVLIGLESETLVEIKEGLNEGDLVIMN